MNFLQVETKGHDPLNKILQSYTISEVLANATESSGAWNSYSKLSEDTLKGVQTYQRIRQQLNEAMNRKQEVTLKVPFHLRKAPFDSS